MIPQQAAPPTYATAEQARAYVARVLARPAPSSPAPVYLIAPTDLRKSAAWPRIAPALAALLPGCRLAGFHDVWAGLAPGTAPDVDTRIERIAAEFGGALVIPRRVNPEGLPPRYLLGYAARAEAEQLAARGLPVLVLAPRAGLVAWPDVRVHPAAAPAPTWYPLELDMPAPGPGTTLPTVAASYRALGLGRPPAVPAPGRKPRRT